MDFINVASVFQIDLISTRSTEEYAQRTLFVHPVKKQKAIVSFVRSSLSSSINETHTTHARNTKTLQLKFQETLEDV